MPKRRVSFIYFGRGTDLRDHIYKRLTGLNPRFCGAHEFTAHYNLMMRDDIARDCYAKAKTQV